MMKKWTAYLPTLGLLLLAFIVAWQLLKFRQGQKDKLHEGLSAALGKEQKIYRLSLEQRALTALPSSLAQQQQLRELYLAGNCLTNLPQYIYDFRDLVHLDLEGRPYEIRKEACGNQIENLGEELGQLAQLRYLNLNHNALRQLPQSMAQLAQLQQLFLRNNRLKALPDSLLLCQNLQEVDLSRNQLPIFPQQLMQLPQLQRLNLAQNEFGELSPSWPSSLRQLHLMGNALYIYPQPLAPNLEELDLSACSLQAIADSLALQPQLKELHLEHNHLDQLPRHWNMPILEELYLAQNLLTDSALGAQNWPKKLKVLDLQNNKLALSAGLVLGQELEVLRLGHNQIEQWRAQPGPELLLLDLSNNQMDSFSVADLAQYPKLRRLYLDGNPISTECLDQLQKARPQLLIRSE
ncbi:leucine-rich repeat domain-containing protein [Saprospira grandis]|nr:hypothetical protein [Saprospira grandis]